MATFNTVIILGNMCRDPELRVLASGLTVATATVATSRRYTRKTGEKAEETAFIPIEMWGRTAEFATSGRCTKGSQVLVEGRLKTDQWTDETGQKKSMLKMVVLNLQLIRSKTGQSDIGPGSEGEGGEEEPLPFLDDSADPF